MQGISIFQQIYAPRVAHVVTGFDGVSHNTHSPYAMGGVVGSVGKMTAIVANDQADTWHIVNLKCGKIFDAVAVLGAFDESEAANMAMRYHGQYFDAVCGDVCESNTGGLQRFLNHPVYMRTNRPVYAEELAKLQDISSTQAILWDGVQLKSHNGSSKHLLLDMMRCDDDKALLEKMDFVEEESQLDGEIAEYDALVVEAYKLESTVSKLALAMDKATSISTLKVANQTLSKPKTMRGFGVIQQLVLFELSDGQAVSIIFNVSDSEANASAKMTKDDLLVAWKYKLNSRDITAAVQPNATQNVSLNMIASRIMGLADANSEKFVAAQKKKDAMQTELANTNQRVKDLQGQEQALLQEIADLQKQLDEKAKMVATEGEKNANDYSFVRDDFNKQKYRLVDADGKELQAIWKSGSTWAMSTGESFKTLVEAKQAAIDNAKFWMKIQQEEAASRAEVEAMSKERSDNKISDPAEKEANKVKTPTGEELRQQGYNGVISELKKLGWTDDAVTGGLSKSFAGVVEKGSVNPEGVLTVAVTSKDGNMMAIVGDAIVRNSVVTIPQYGLTAQTEESYKKEAEKINKAVNFYIDDVRPFIRGELLQDVFVVKKGGVYNSDLEMNNLNHSIKVFLPRGFEKDLKENMTVKATISREYKHDWRLKSVDEIIDDPLKQQREIQEAEYQKSVGYNQLKFIKDNADSLLYEMDAKKTDSITTIEGFGQKTTVTRQQVMDVIKERMPKPQPEPVAQVVEPTTQDRHTDGQDNEIERIASLYAAALGHPVSKRSREFANDILSKNAYGLEFIANGMNDKGKKVFSEVTGVSLPKQQGATWKAIRDWAGVSDEQENHRVAMRDVAYATKAFMRDNNVGQDVADKNKELIASKIAEGFNSIEKIGNNYWFTDGKGQGINLSEKPKKGYLGLSKSRALVEAMLVENKAKKLLDASAIQSQPNNTLQKDISKSELFKDANVWAIDDFGKENGMVIYSRDEQDGFSIGIVDKLKQVNMQYTDIDTDQQTNESFSTENITNEQVIEKIKMFIAKHEQKSVELLPVQPASKPPMTNPDRDYLQSIIDGDVDPLIVDMDAVIALAEKYDGDAEITPLLDQALEVINQAEQEAAKGI